MSSTRTKECGWRRVARCSAMIALLALAFSLMPLGAPGTAQAQPTVTSLKITPSSWEGWAIYDIVEFKVEPVWSDGVPDPDCTRAGSPPVWTTTYGWFEKEKTGLDAFTMAVPGSSISQDPNKLKYSSLTGPKVIWSTNLAGDMIAGGYGEGQVNVSYGGKTASANVKAKEPDANLIPPGYIGAYEVLSAKVKDNSEYGVNMFNGMFWGSWTLDWSYRTETYYNNQTNKVTALSQDLENYIRRWLRGEVPAKLPDNLLPPDTVCNNTFNPDWVLCRPEEVRPEDVWLVRPATYSPNPNFQELYREAPDPNCTYILIPAFFAPFGSRLVMEGDFPHCRFFDVQVSPPYDPRFPVWTGGQGNMDVPMVDADINPDPGHVNPFRVGANRNATNRHYHLYFNLEKGNPRDLNEAIAPGSMTPGNWRNSQNNTRVAGPFEDMGAGGKGAIGPGYLWLRYYVPDAGKGPLAGVALPKVWLELSTGEKFWIKHDMRVVRRRTNFPTPGVSTPARNPEWAWNSSFGWAKVFGGWLMYAEAIGKEICDNPENWLLELWMGGEWGVKSRIRDLDKCYSGRGADMPPPGCYEPYFTLCVYNNFLTRVMQMGSDKVLVITGKMPNIPKTRSGQATTQGGQARYLSFTVYGEAPDDAYEVGVMYANVCDEDIVLKNGWYTIVFSTAANRPANATAANGVTWVNYGTSLSDASIFLRWQSVVPEWDLPTYDPDENNLPWWNTAWSAAFYDKNQIGNNWAGKMGDYHPVLHYMTKSQFEAYGSNINPQTMGYTSGW
ncbi:hypothetical protein [Candidatus Solincola tengchongensis]|uniref:hypothetical protein n=1 Tax=Candidatus Solincola tengchongensis TaxID=2900693 RepID=UPI00257E18A4|nr:hypothetical protein [Candidatus Solincola tengchongensis]